MFASNSKQIDDIGMSELGHEGSFLEEFYFVLGTTFVECLQSNFNIFRPILPRPSFDPTKTTRPKVTYHSAYNID